PRIGRFLSTDPLIAHPGSTQSINPYSYVENNPLNKTDPTGQAPATTGCLNKGGGTCTFTPTGSHIPTTAKSTPTSSGGLSFSGSMALPGGHGFATSVDFNSTATVSVQGAIAKNSAGRDSNKVSKHKYTASNSTIGTPSETS